MCHHYRITSKSCLCSYHDDFDANDEDESMSEISPLHLEWFCRAYGVTCRPLSHLNNSTLMQSLKLWKKYVGKMRSRGRRQSQVSTSEKRINPSKNALNVSCTVVFIKFKIQQIHLPISQQAKKLCRAEWHGILKYQVYNQAQCRFKKVSLYRFVF